MLQRFLLPFFFVFRYGRCYLHWTYRYLYGPMVFTYIYSIRRLVRHTVGLPGVLLSVCLGRFFILGNCVGCCIRSRDMPFLSPALEIGCGASGINLRSSGTRIGMLVCTLLGMFGGVCQSSGLIRLGLLG